MDWQKTDRHPGSRTAAGTDPAHRNRLAAVQHPYTAGKTHHSRSGRLRASGRRSRKRAFHADTYRWKPYSSYTSGKISGQMPFPAPNGPASDGKPVESYHPAERRSRPDPVKPSKIRTDHRRSPQHVRNPDRYGAFLFDVSQRRHRFDLSHAASGHFGGTGKRKYPRHFYSH